MYINEYSVAVALFNWINDEYSNSKIIVDEKSDFFDKHNINELQIKQSVLSKDKLIVYNYINNYLYSLQLLIKQIDPEFSFSYYKNIYEFKEKYDCDTIEDIDLLVFLKWFLEDGLLTIKEFLNSLDSKMYKIDDMYNIAKYYNYLIISSLKNNESATTFLTEGSTCVFEKICEYVVEPITFESLMHDLTDYPVEREQLDSINVLLGQELKISMPACNMQANFMWRSKNEIRFKILS